LKSPDMVAQQLCWACECAQPWDGHRGGDATSEYLDIEVAGNVVESVAEG
jgi:hypothetical protein